MNKPSYVLPLAVAVPVLGAGLFAVCLRSPSHSELGAHAPVAGASETALQPVTEARLGASDAAQLRQLKQQLSMLEHKLEQVSEQSAARADPRKAPDADDNTQVDTKGTEAADSPDRALGTWMRDAIHGEEWDRTRTEQVEDELNAALAHAPTLHLENVECGPRFCSSVFSSQDHSEPSMRALWGLPPFDGEGFVEPGEDGKVAVFFAKPGHSMDTLRAEAQLARAR